MRASILKVLVTGCICLALTAASLHVSLSYADTVYLKNGGKLEGKVTEDGDKVTVDTKWGPITVSKGSVERIVREGEKEEEGLVFPRSGEGAAKKPPAKEEDSSPRKSASKKSAKDTLKSVLKSITEKELTDHVKYLASPKLEGRAAGGGCDKAAARYIAKEFKKYGLKPGGDKGDYLQEFSTRRGTTWNVVGYLPGEDRAAKEQVVVVGGHYDHIGKGRAGLCPGADDNASGTAGVLEIAEAFAEEKLPHSRTIVFVCFGAEEAGLLGSRHYVQKPTFPIANTVAMVNIDMISRNSPERLGVANAGPEWDAVLEEANKHGKFDIRRGNIGASDHASFQRAGVPVAFFCTGMHADLHKPSDTPDRCDFKKAEKVAETVCLVALGVTSSEGKFGKTKKEDMEKELGGRLGILTGVTEIPAKVLKKYDIPEERRGILVEKVIDGLPAHEAKLKEGDIIIEFNGHEFPGEGALQEFEKAVAEAPAGQPVECVVIRNAVRKNLQVKFSKE